MKMVLECTYNMEEKRFRLLYGKDLSENREVIWLDTQEEVDTFLENLGEGIGCSVVDNKDKMAEFHYKEVKREIDKEIAEEILGNLKLRKGFHYWWDDIDCDIQDEILEEIAEIAESKLK